MKVFLLRMQCIEGLNNKIIEIIIINYLLFDTYFTYIYNLSLKNFIF